MLKAAIADLKLKLDAEQDKRKSFESEMKARLEKVEKNFELVTAFLKGSLVDNKIMPKDHIDSVIQQLQTIEENNFAQPAASD